MKIVIDIPDDAYKTLLEDQRVPIGLDLEYLVMHGIPLPKGHGRLKDTDAIKPIYAPIAPLTPEDFFHYEWVYMKSEIDRASAIIEADGGGE